jgi:hypothetical protein
LAAAALRWSLRKDMQNVGKCLYAKQALFQLLFHRNSILVNTGKPVAYFVMQRGSIMELWLSSCGGGSSSSTEQQALFVL